MKRTLFFLTFLLAAKVGMCGYDLNQVMTELENREKTLNTVQFDFTQEINFIQMNNKTTIAGEVLFGKSGKMRVTKTMPDKQVTISDGRKVWVYNPAANQVWEGSSKKWLEGAALPKGLMPLNNYVSDLRKNFDLTLVESDKNEMNQVVILAEPKNKSLGYKMKLTFSTDSWLPVKTVFVSDSAKVETLLSKQLINPDVPESAFKFSAPKGVDVIPFN